MLKKLIILSVLLLTTSGCSTTIKIPPGLLQECDKTLPKLKGGTKKDILLWKIEADKVYTNCRDGKYRLIKAVE